MNKKTIIIGGVAGGATTAARLRRKSETMEIIMFEKGSYISYANCGLPYYIGDVIKSRDALLLQTPEAMKEKFNIDVRIKSEVIKIDKEQKSLQVKNIDTNEIYEESYDTLVIATGSTPIKPSLEGIDNPNIHTLWTIPDTDMIKKIVTNNKPKHATVIGGGFIGLEMAENLHAVGIKVSVVELQKQVMTSLDYEMAQLLHENMSMNNIELILGDGVKSFSTNNEKTRIHLQSGKIVETNLVILAIGVLPNSKLAKEAGLLLNEKGGIIVDKYLKTSDPDIYAVGDVVEVEQLALNKSTMIPLAGPANKQGRICADNITGSKKIYKGSLGTSVAQVFDLVAASTGVNEVNLKLSGKEKGVDYYSIIINQKSHAGYYPGASPLTLKMLFNKEGIIFGAQIVGQEGVDKRIDTIATTIRLGGTIYDLAELELAYAPPFSSAKDPVNMLGFVAENVVDGLVTFIDWNQLDQLLEEKEKEGTYTILDVTEDMERMVFSIPNSYHIPLGQLHSRMEELNRKRQIIIYCAIGVRSYNAARMLSQNGFDNVKVLSAGTAFYKSMHYNDNNTITCAANVQEDQSEFKKTEDNIMVEKEVRILDCCGLQCPGPIMKVNEAIQEMKDCEVLKVSATDMGFARDVEAWCRRTGNTLIKTERIAKENIVYLQKGTDSCELPTTETAPSPQGKTMVVFSGDLDKVLASFIIANGAAAMGRPVTMFFTFWGLNALRKSEKQQIKKPFIEKMFGGMMPRGSKKLKLSKMNMGGMGTKMMKMVMKEKNVDSLEMLMQHAMNNGVKLVACTMSMDIMGITKEELIEGVELAGVASYLGDAEESNVNLFI